MSKFDTSVPAPPPPPPPPAPPTPVAPVPPAVPDGPESADTPDEPAVERDDRLGKMLALIALVSLGVALITTVLWLGARGDDSDAEPIADPDVVAEEQAQLTEAEAQVANLQEDVDRLEAEVAASEQRVAELSDAESELTQAQADLAAAQADLADTQAELDEALAQIASLEEQLAAAGETETPQESDGADADTADTPEFDRWIGELLSSRTGSSRLGAEAATCFGGAVVDQIGLDALGAGQNNAASGADRQVVIDAMVAAAATCNIDQSLIFG